MKENKKQDIELTAQNDYQNEEDDPIVSYINEKKICIQNSRNTFALSTQNGYL